jgi:hypothetical protein
MIYELQYLLLQSSQVIICLCNNVTGKGRSLATKDQSRWIIRLRGYYKIKQVKDSPINIQKPPIYVRNTWHLIKWSNASSYVSWCVDCINCPEPELLITDFNRTITHAKCNNPPPLRAAQRWPKDSDKGPTEEQAAANSSLFPKMSHIYSLPPMSR